MARFGLIDRGVADGNTNGTLVSHPHLLHGPLGAAFRRSRAGQEDQPRSPAPLERDAILLTCPDSGLEFVPLEQSFVEVVIIVGRAIALCRRIGFRRVLPGSARGRKGC